ncbi:MAG: hypothetical protein E4H28_04120 [Gemmatimonadales bacterium]|nr:MAG: hypothetical protein E4H28_04120 [Gemmatimonadales bacterium]
MAFWTQDKLDALGAAYSQGAKSVTYGDKTVSFHSVSDYERLRAIALSQINVSAATGRSTVAAFSSG